MSNNRHQEIKIRVCIFYKKKNNKRHIVFQLFLESPWNVQNVLFFLKIRICYITCTKIMLWFFSSSQFFFIVFFVFCFFYFLFCSFFKVIKIDQSFCEEDFHLWLINSWGHEQESPTTWVLSFFLKKKKNIHAHTHKHTRSHMFLLLSMFKSWCLVMVWSTVLFQLDPVGLDSSCALSTTLLGAGEHTQPSVDTLNLLKFIVWIYLDHSGHFAFYTCTVSTLLHRSLNLLNLKMST